MGFTVSNADKVVFQHIDGDRYTLVAVATDDFTIIVNSQEESNTFKAELGKHFELVDLGAIHWLLGMQIMRDLDAKTISIGQKAYIKTLVE